MTNKDLSFLGDVELEWPELKTMIIMVSISQEDKVAKALEVVVKYYINSKDSNV
ncbi:hypothetical protein [Vibrio sp. V08_P9A1T1]|uniref:hypothetical protein n=1 Tax=Vibrio sp. V08_P9A1T1 TaxID=1938663 RepID=UPI0015952B42|nr:hypothetical protein [Vibrio sp. V08_P9A1T1]